MLKGKTALITGSTGGIGEAFARAFAAEGCNVMMNGLGEPAAIEKLRGSIAQEHGVKVAYHGADVGVPSQIEDLVRETEAKLGPVDILVNNAVVRHYDKIEDFPVDKWDRAIAVDLSAAFHTIRLTMRGMKQRGWGRIINMSSIHGRMAVPNRVDYVTAKHALIGMTRAVALECAQHGVTINALMPGWVLTPHAEGQITRQMAASGESHEQALHTLLSVRQHSQRPILPSDIAAFGVFLCSAPGAHINGAALPIDGAWQTGFMLTAGNAK
ncbi:MAG: SDR family NAD(P)-dependent oxidoreductase [Betaproteobacteria bacterium]|nr:SDR family NAD(P)-dependent oxidoreductase [Betaproteobacteria bacterium]